MCAQCIAGKEKEQRDIYFENLWYLRALKQAGYPVGKNDWSIETWLDLYELEIELEKYKAEQIKKK